MEGNLKIDVLEAFAECVLENNPHHKLFWGRDDYEVSVYSTTHPGPIYSFEWLGYIDENGPYVDEGPYLIKLCCEKASKEIQIMKRNEGFDCFWEPDILVSVDRCVEGITKRAGH